MALPSHESFLKFANKVRAQEAPFNAAASEAFAALIGMEYRRLRAAELESGKGVIVLMVEVRCNFQSGKIVMTTIPQASQPVGRTKTVELPK